MTYQQIITDLKNKIYKPIYFLMGEEPYYIDKISDYIQKNVLTESEQTFNQITLYGKDTDIETVINSAKRYPMMANHQVVIVKEAQEIRKIEDLIFYAEHTLSSTILVINYKYKKLDKRKKLSKVLSKSDALFESKKLYENKIPEWINNYLKSKKVEIEPKASILLTEFLGTDLTKIANELDKLLITLPKDSRKITSQHIERNIGISKDYNNFELNKALSDRNILKANRIISYFASSQKNNPITLTITLLYSHFSKILTYHFIKDKSRNNVSAVLKINPFFVSDYEKAARNYPARKVVDIISLLRKYDLKSKGFGNTSSSPGDLLKELIYHIMH